MPRTVTPATCSLCSRPARRRGWCNPHYQRWYRHGDPLGKESFRTPKYQPLEDRFWAKVDKSGSCWMWTASVDGHGYGQIDVDGRPRKASRVSWELHNGPIPEEMEVCHSCDTPACVRPEHLWLGTHAENLRDMGDKGRYMLPDNKGEKAPAAKLTEDDVRAIRTDTRPLSVVAAEYGIDRTNVWLIRKRKSWAWLPG